MAKVLASELCANAHLTGDIEHALLPLQVSKASCELISAGVKVVIVLGGRHLDRFEVHIGRQATNDNGEMVWWTGSSSESLDLFFQKGSETFLIEHSLCFLEEKRFVGRTSSLCHEQEVVLIAICGVEVDLCWKVAPSVLLIKHGERCHLTVTQVATRVCVVYSPGDCLLVIAIGPHVLTTFANCNTSTCILAAWENHARSNVCVLDQFKRDKAVVLRCFWVLQDVTELLQVSWAQEVRNVSHGLLRQGGQSLRRNLQDFAPVDFNHIDAIGGDLLVGRCVWCGSLKYTLVLEGHGFCESRACNMKPTGVACHSNSSSAMQRRHGVCAVVVSQE
eukprot:m.33334 g.33334  ORF g.33334 m.33334 type:complete len:334 (+) comp9607_c1_seq2:3071-4072(+)